jgi:hypothetical protein
MPGISDEMVQICTPKACAERVVTPAIMCSVYEDLDTDVKCFRITATTCDAVCPHNMDPQLSDVGNTCEVTPCDLRTPNLISGACQMSGDSASCFALQDLNRCYSTCPSHTAVNTTVAANPRCVAVQCESRTPDSRGVCAITAEDQCFSFDGKCVVECPALTGITSEEEKVGGRN